MLNPLTIVMIVLTVLVIGGSIVGAYYQSKKKKKLEAEETAKARHLSELVELQKRQTSDAQQFTNCRYCNAKLSADSLECPSCGSRQQ